MEPYLYFIMDCEIRRNLAKLRCSNHFLSIESGRYLKLLTVFVNNVTELKAKPISCSNAAFILSRDRNSMEIIIFVLTVSQKKHL